MSVPRVPAGNGAGQSADASEAAAHRAERMGVLARAEAKSLARLWGGLGVDPAFETLRGPESGLIALRGRMGGGGAPFNFGEATATRATVKLGNGAVGHAVTLGRDTVKARLAAVIDALAQDNELAGRIDAQIIAPLRQEEAARNKTRREKTEATKVDFFTMVRGEDE